ncbi:MAG: DUF4238 domain-containing protein [Nitrospinae bacterium]|nr:DUF4238 domain-containing protein [Nitrospinota bacterium]
MKLTNKKKQHYVPQMIQRRFSNDGKRVSVWDIRNRRLYENVPIRGQLQEKYFYERTEDGFEKALESLEDIAKPLFDEIEESQRIPPKDSDDWILLILWVVVQVQRTDVLANPINKFSQDMIRKVAQFLEAEGQIPGGPDGLGMADIGIKVDPKWGRQNAVAVAFETAQVAADLHAGILHSKDGKVILPDCGAVRFNMIAEEGGLPWGWASIGTGALLPLSNKNAVVFYDPASYTWMDNGMEVIKVMGEAEQISLTETLLLRSSNRVVLNTDPEWIVKVDTDLHVKCARSGTPAISIPGLIPHPPLMKLAHEAQSRLFGPPPRPTSKIG